MLHGIDFLNQRELSPFLHTSLEFNMFSLNSILEEQETDDLSHTYFQKM